MIKYKNFLSLCSSIYLTREKKIVDENTWIQSKTASQNK